MSTRCSLPMHSNPASLLLSFVVAAGLAACASVTPPPARSSTAQELAARLGQRFPQPHFLNATFSVVDRHGRAVETDLDGPLGKGKKMSLSGFQITARPGQKAKIEHIREFIYPSETVPPVIEGSMVAAPLTPKAFATKNLGWEIDSLRMATQGGFIVVSGTFRETVFAGFQPSTGALFSPITNDAGQILTENRLEAPAFSIRETTFHAALVPGETREVGVALSGGPAFLRITAKAIHPKSGQPAPPLAR